MTRLSDEGGDQRGRHRPSVPVHGCITSMDITSGDADARHIAIDGTRAATLLEADVVRLNLGLDTPLSPDLAERIAYHHEYRLAWRATLKRLERSSRSQQDVLDHLLERGHEQEVAEQVITTLVSNGLLDDARFAASAAESIARRTPGSASYIESRLLRHGIQPTQARDAARDAAGDPVEIATEIARKALRSLHTCTPETQVRRLHGRLARRGFELDVIEAALRRLELDLPE